MHARFKDLFSLKGKTAVVTGGAGILGNYFCRALAEFGANVVVVDMKKKGAAALADQIANEYGVKALGIECDIADPSSVKKMVQKVVQQFKKIHVLLNNAASK